MVIPIWGNDPSSLICFKWVEFTNSLFCWGTSSKACVAMEDDEEKDRGNKCLKETVTESFNNYQAS